MAIPKQARMPGGDKPVASTADLLAPYEEMDLKRWCVEQAIHWPTIKEVRLGTVNPPGQPTTGADVDVDLIGRAEKIRKWVVGE